MIKSIIIVASLALISCQTAPKKSQLGEKEGFDFFEENISTSAVLNLGTTSFIKGCLEGLKVHVFEKTNGKKLEFCKAAARNHEMELRSLLE